MKRHIPNTITLCNLVCGSIAVRYAFCGQYVEALLFIVLGAVFDFFDGFTARKLNVSSPIGVELDSLADLITFGFAPSAMFYSLIGRLSPGCGAQCCPVADGIAAHINVAAFLIVAFSALRLAKFNLDTRQTTSFLGLPTPANALLLSSVAIAFDRYFFGAAAPVSHSAGLTAVVVLLAITLVSCALLVSEIPLFALKFKNFSWRDNAVRFVFLGSSVLVLVASALTGIENITTGIGICIIWYVVLSLVSARKAK